jgi:hypothetical protein
MAMQEHYNKTDSFLTGWYHKNQLEQKRKEYSEIYEENVKPINDLSKTLEKMIGEE